MKVSVPWAADFAKGQLEPVNFRSPLHCAKLSNDGLLYACDRGNNRVQMFKAADVGKPCANPEREVGKCGFVGEIRVAPQTSAGTSGTLNFSTDPKQTCSLRRRPDQRHGLRDQPAEQP